MNHLYQQLQVTYPGLELTPVPEFGPRSDLKWSAQLPVDYIQWMREIGCGKWPNAEFELYPYPKIGSAAIPDARRHGLANMVVIGADQAYNYVGFTTLFERWYIVAVVGELRIVVTPRDRMTFSDYMEYMAQPNVEKPTDDESWQKFARFMSNYAVWGSVVFIGSIFLIYFLYDVYVTKG